MKLIETPRDGWQGINKIVPTNEKIDYLNSLLKVGFDIVEIGSFVSPKAIPQLADTAQVLDKIDMSNSRSEIMVLIGNQKGLDIALQYPQIDFISYPHSISNVFLQKNLNINIEQSKIFVDNIANTCLKNNKTPMIYLTMAFGNPYGDDWNIDIIIENIKYLSTLGIKHISFTDILGISTIQNIINVFSSAVHEFPKLNLGFHLHTIKEKYYNKIDAAYKSGCRMFDSVINGYGGCPMTGKELMGNLDTSDLLGYFSQNHIKPGKLNVNLFEETRDKASVVFEN